MHGEDSSGCHDDSCDYSQHIQNAVCELELRFCVYEVAEVVLRGVDRVVPGLYPNQSGCDTPNYDEDEAIDELEVARIVSVVLAKEVVDVVNYEDQEQEVR